MGSYETAVSLVVMLVLVLVELELVLVELVLVVCEECGGGGVVVVVVGRQNNTCEPLKNNTLIHVGHVLYM